jgi:hypothetical protein
MLPARRTTLTTMTMTMTMSTSTSTRTRTSTMGLTRTPMRMSTIRTTKATAMAITPMLNMDMTIMRTVITDTHMP